MTTSEFGTIVRDELDYCIGLLTSKGASYASSYDRLQHFKDAARFMDITPSAALLGQMTKHLVSIKDMIKIGTVNSSIKQWQEKISDSINYLLLLYAIVVEEDAERCAKYTREDHDVVPPISSNI